MTTRSLLAVLVLVGSALVLSHGARAQTDYSTPGRERAQARRALREARKKNNPYADTHLHVTPSQLRDGTSANQPATDDGRKKYKFRHDGMPRVTPPMSSMVPRIPPFRYWFAKRPTPKPPVTNTP